MKRTPFHTIHVALGAKMVPFAGYDMPVRYAGTIEEHKAVRNAVGVFDVSHMGEFEIRGNGAAEFLQYVTINDITRLSEGKAQYSAICTEKGGIIDDLLVYHRADRYLVVVNAANAARDLEWLNAHRPESVEIRDISDSVSLLAVQGPRSIDALQPLTDVSLKDIPFYQFRQGTFSGNDAIISRTGYTGELGFELYFERKLDNAEGLWNSIFEAGKPYGIVPVGLGARDTLRLEMGYCLHGQDIDDSTTPLQAGLGWITKLSKGEFIGRDVLAKEKAGKLPRKLVGLSLPGRMIARTGFLIKHGETTTGRVTSGTFSPSLEASIALGYVLPEDATEGTILEVDIRGRLVEATVVPTPFYAPQR